MNQNSANVSLNKEALAAVLLDLQSCGVTDIIADTSFDFYAESVIRKPASPVKQAVENTKVTQQTQNQPEVREPISTPVIKSVKSSVIDLEKHVWMIRDDSQIICVSNASKTGEEPFNSNEKILFTNMLKAIGLDIEEVGYLVVEDAFCTEDNQEQLTQICRRHLSSSKAQIVISFGENTCPILMGGNVSLSSVRGFGKEVAGVRYVATYSPRSLLKQPLLKRLAWEDLQIAYGYMKVLSDV